MSYQEKLPEPAVAILLADCFDDWLMDLKIPIETFCDQMMGSWVFNYSQGLQKAGVRTVVFCVSRQVTTPTKSIHKLTGATIYVLPPSKLYGFLRKHSNCTTAGVESRDKPKAGLRSMVWRALRRLVSTHLETPLTMLFTKLKQEGCRCLLVQEYESARFDLCVFMGLLKRVAVFGTFQGGQPQTLLLRPLRRLAMWLCAGLLIPAKNEYKRVMTRYGLSSDKLAIVYSPVDLAVFYPASKEEARRSLGIPDNIKVVIYHGAITFAYKGLDVLMEAWGLICQRQSQDLRLILIGTGDDAYELSNLISSRQLTDIQWVNQWVHDRALIQRYLSSSDIYVFPSRGDACPNAVIEAMACGLPIVASNVNGIPDILNDGERSGGILVPPGDASALAIALARVVDDHALRHELGRRAQNRVMSKFSMQTVGTQLREFLLPLPI